MVIFREKGSPIINCCFSDEIETDCWANSEIERGNKEPMKNDISFVFIKRLFF
jgi:hypothetical protein